MKKNLNGEYVEMTPEEIAKCEAFTAEQERHYWTTVPYGSAVNERIRMRYTDSQEFATLRQRDSKPEEWDKYNIFCEDCKAVVKSKFAEYGREVPA